MRLIDADEFGEMLEAYGELDGAALLKDYPIAYDVDKVVERLEIEGVYEDAPLYAGDREADCYIRLGKAIEIVKSGGIE